MTRVLLLHAGGTFGMIKENGYYRVEPDAFEHNLRSYKQFNYDPTNGLMFYMDDEISMNYEIYEWRIKDSSDANTKDYLDILNAIRKNYYDYDAFIVVHGTDTLCYAATVTSFLVENLSKPIIFTGSMIPLIEPHTDAVDNLSGAFKTLTLNPVPNVYIYFNHELLLANRTTKIHACSADAYASKPSKFVNWDGKTKFYVELANDIQIIRVHPFMDLEITKMILASSKAVIIEGYGCGNIPNNLLELIKLHSECTLVVIISQCINGRVSGSYEAGNSLLHCKNVINGEDMTAEAALAKLSFLLANFEFDQVKVLFRENLRGEITFPEED